MTLLPLELIDKAIGSRITILMKNDIEFTGTLLGNKPFPITTTYKRIANT